MFRQTSAGLEVLLVHPGGPFWAKKDLGAWTIPKGEVQEGETDLQAARREFQEETGLTAGEPLIPLGEVKQKSGKMVAAWAFCGDCDPAAIRSNTFSLEWPPKSGRMQEFPEIDQAEFFTLAEAGRKILPAQAPFLDVLAKACGVA